jgi:hypothetical protein
MGDADAFDVDPRSLRLPPSRMSGADPGKLQRQIATFGRSTSGMPQLFVFRASDGELIIYDGVTRATRIAKLLPAATVEVEVIGNLASSGNWLPTVGDKLP